MIGQASLFAPDETLPLRKRVEVHLVPLADVRMMLERWHYLHRVRTGRQLNYAVLIDGIVDGVITYAYPMMSAPLAGVPSDELVEFARMYLHSNVPHTATCAIGKTLRRIRQDWLNAYPDAKPVRLVVSWSDTTRHVGTIYKAANFEWFRRSAGQNRKNLGSRQARWGGTKRIAYGDYDHEKDCWIYRLDK